MLISFDAVSWSRLGASTLELSGLCIIEPSTTSSHTPFSPKKGTKSGLSKDYPELIWALFWLGGVWLGVVLSSIKMYMLTMLLPTAFEFANSHKGCPTVENSAELLVICAASHNKDVDAS